MHEVPARDVVVVDNGSGCTKVGWAGEDAPVSIISTLVGHSNDGYVVGSQVSYRMNVMQPIEKSDYRLGFDGKTLQAVLLTDSPLRPHGSREKMVEIMIETFNAPKVAIAMQAPLSLYAINRTTGTVVDCGEGVTHLVPVIDGCPIRDAIIEVDLAGKDVTDQLIGRLRNQGLLGGYFTGGMTRLEREIVRDIKEKLCDVALDFDEESSSSPSSSFFAKPTKDYTLPDGRKIDMLGTERVQAPEVLFQPNKLMMGKEGLKGLHENLYDCIWKCDRNIRSTLSERVVLTGGGTLFPGFCDRMTKEFIPLVPRTFKVHVIAWPERKYLNWRGGSILACLPSFQQNWVSKEGYNEEGPSVVHKKCVYL